MKLNCSFQDIAKAVHAEHDCSNIIETIFIDSRKPVRGNEVLFIAIKGPNNDGHKYIPKLVAEGVKHFIVEDKFDSGTLDANFIRVNNSLKALQNFAAWHRSRFNYPVLGITGSAGKTSVKEWLYHLLKDDYNIVRSPKSFNSQVGVPLSILEMTDQHNLAIIEAGISEPGEMGALKHIIQPNIGVLTTLGEAHIHNFYSNEELESEKLLLFADSDWYIDGREVEEESPDILMNDQASLHNAKICWAFIKKFDGLRAEHYRPKFEKLENLALRLEIQRGINNNIIVNDSYNSDINGLAIGLDLAASQPKEDLVLILSDIDTDQASKDEVYKSAAEIINRYNVVKTIGIGTDVTRLAGLVSDFQSYTSIDELDTKSMSGISNSSILLKGARKFKFERLGRIIQEKHHDTVLEINLKALEHNLNIFKSKLNGVKIMCMVKAFGYGAGDLEIAKLMERQGIEALGVAYADEGIALRNAGIKLPILVMNSEPAAFNGIIENQLQPVIYNERILDAFIRELINYGQSNYPIHLELETGMNRLGVRYHELPDVCAELNAQPEVKVVSVFSHLAVSDDETEDEFTNQQILRFTEGADVLEKQLGYNFDRHICNSAGILRFPEAHFDMVRLGVGVYGVDPTGRNAHGLEQVGTLKTTITQIKEFRDSETIGYGRSGAANRGERIGVIPIGYADGLRRSLSNGNGSFWVNGSFAPIVGKVCMDMTMINISEIEAKEGDEVEIFGPNIPIEELAVKMKTIPYEVLTSISARVKRTYVRD